MNILITKELLDCALGYFTGVERLRFISTWFKCVCFRCDSRKSLNELDCFHNVLIPKKYIVQEKTKETKNKEEDTICEIMSGACV
jgi:hypothetical protein